MVAHDQSDDTGGGRFPSDETLARLRETLRHFIEEPGDEREVCEVLDSLSREAHGRRLRAEDVLVAFKRCWNELPEVSALRNRSTRQQLLGRLITLCIDSYYSR